MMRSALASLKSWEDSTPEDGCLGYDDETDMCSSCDRVYDFSELNEHKEKTICNDCLEEIVTDEKAEELIEELNEILGFSIPENFTDRIAELRRELMDMGVDYE